MQHATSDGILTQQEETQLQDFRDRMANRDLPGIVTGSATLDRAASDRIAAQARRAALSTRDGGAALKELDNALLRAMPSGANRRQPVVRAGRKPPWEPSRPAS